MNKIIQRTLILISLMLVSSVNFASIIATPLDLNPGDQYRLVFITQGKIQATSSDISVYNSFISDEANAQTELAALGTNWTAIASTSLIDARDNTSTNFNLDAGVSIFTLVGTKVADDYLDFWDGTHETAINIGSDGILATNSARTWSGTNGDGTGATHSTGGMLGVNSKSWYADMNASTSNNRWIKAGLTFNSSSHRMYGISDVLTVGGSVADVPAPAPLFLIGLGALGLMRVRGRGKQ